MTSATQRLSVRECGDARLKACLLLLLFTVFPDATMCYPVNYRPVIGILSQELTEYMQEKHGNYTSYIAASYVKHVESAGARVVPIKINQTESYYQHLIDYVNGILIPGGAANFSTSGGYGDAARQLYSRAVLKNSQGSYFPVWGTCRGFELLTYLANGSKDILTNCKAENVALPLKLKPDYNSSKLFGDAPKDILDILVLQNVTANFHHFCVTEANITSSGLDRDWRVTAVSKDTEGLEFVSSFEHRLYPIYGVQFHPEKNAYEWKVTNKIPHTVSAVSAGQYFANFFINEARKNTNQFPSTEEEEKALIYNYQPTYTGKSGSTFEQCYFFTD
jgi:gamma-glutamyl-gamma-aminobutyrate hydrolase PuuD